MTKAAALYCGENRLNIRVNSVHPATSSPPWPTTTPVRTARPSRNTPRSSSRSTPSAYLGKPEDIAYGYVYLSSDEADFVSGTQLAIDGCYTAQ